MAEEPLVWTIGCARCQWQSSHSTDKAMLQAEYNQHWNEVHSDGCQHVWGFDGALIKCGLCGKVREDLEAALIDGQVEP